MTNFVQPLVSCIMPTANRRLFVPQAISYFQAQTYQNRELVIMDDGEQSLADLIPANDPRIRYIRLVGQRSLGAKRNLCVEACLGDLIMHWDDDDWMASHRIQYQLEAMLADGSEVCGLQQMLFYELANGQTWLYSYPPSHPQAADRNWLAGGSLLYTRDFWKRAPFPDIQVASDTRFIWNHQLNRATVLTDYTFYVATIHSANTSPKNCRGSYWSRWQGDLPGLLKAEYAFYQRFRADPTANLASKGTGQVRPSGAEQAPVPVLPFSNVNPPTEIKPRRLFQKMKIGYILLNFPALSETFIRREVLALCQAGNQVVVYTHFLHRDPLVPELAEPNLSVRQLSFLHDRASLLRAVQSDGVQHLHSSLMMVAQQATYEVARSLQLPFTLTAYSGYDTFKAVDTRFYQTISADEFCEAIIVEDEFMREWVCSKLGALPDKVQIIPNSLDLEVYRLPVERPARQTVVILAVARFVPKKGLLDLIQAFNRLCNSAPAVELWLVGNGPDENQLMQAASHNPRIKFLGAVSEEKTRQYYQEADIFCLPCIQTADGDADGVPTTILEAMAFELPIVSTNLLSMPMYVRDGHEGILTAPGDIEAISGALIRLCVSPEIRQSLGKAGRARVSQLCNLKENSARLKSIMLNSRWRRWEASLAALQENRRHYTPDREKFYTEHRQRASAYFKFPPGRLLDIGCGRGQMRDHLPPGTQYFGCDPLLEPGAAGNFIAVAAQAESLPYKSGSFDSVLLYAVLAHVFDVEKVLAEAARVLKPGGQLFMHETVNDPNPIHLNHLSDTDLRKLVSEHFNLVEWKADGPQYLSLKAQKPFAAPQAPALEMAPPPPLVSIAITTYNRGRYLRTCINSALQQSHRPVEVVVVDDGSTDDTAHILAEFGNRIKVAFNGQNRGIAFTKNRALRMTSPEAAYVAILDSDDYYRADFVEKCLNFLEKQPAVGLVYTDDIVVDAAGRTLYHQPSIEPWSVETWLRTCNLRGDSWLARRELVMQTDLHDERMALDVDYDLFYQLLEFTNFAHLAEPLVYLRQHSEQSSLKRFELARCHAANLTKYGYSIVYAYHRAQGHPEWFPAIEAGLELGTKLRAERLEKLQMRNQREDQKLTSLVK